MVQSSIEAAPVARSAERRGRRRVAFEFDKTVWPHAGMFSVPIVDLSAMGMACRHIADLAPGDTMHLNFANLMEVPCIVVSSRADAPPSAFPHFRYRIGARLSARADGRRLMGLVKEIYQFRLANAAGTPGSVTALGR